MKYFIQHRKHEISEEEALSYLSPQHNDLMIKDGDTYQIVLSAKITLEVMCENDQDHNRFLKHMNIRDIYDDTDGGQ